MKHVASPCVVFPTWFSVNASTLPETEMSNLARSEEHWKSKYKLSGLPCFFDTMRMRVPAPLRTGSKRPTVQFGWLRKGKGEAFKNINLNVFLDFLGHIFVSQLMTFASSAVSPRNLQLSQEKMPAPQNKSLSSNVFAGVFFGALGQECSVSSAI